jgi:hypothetical protein
MQKASHCPGVLGLKQYRKSGDVRPYDDESFVRVLETAIMIPIPNTIKHVMPTYTVANPAVTNPQAIPLTTSASPTR